MKFTTFKEKYNFIKGLIVKSEGKFFRLVFFKKDGSRREGTFRTGVAKYVTGVGMAYNPSDKGLMSLWETQNKEGAKQAEAYRCVNLLSVVSVTINGETTNFDEDQAIEGINSGK